MANLTYYIFEGTLVGTAGGEGVHFYCGSGGGAGATKSPHTAVANNPYAFGVKEGSGGFGQSRGGPIPIGKYKLVTLAAHPKFGHCCRLDPLSRLCNNRGGFYIHSTGPHGSNGCLVLPRPQLNQLLSAIEKDAGGTLVVQEALGGAQFA